MKKHGGVSFYSNLKSLSYGLLATIIMAILAILVMWPIWYLATKHTKVYTFLIITIVIFALVLLLITKKSKKKINTKSIKKA